MKNKQAQNKKSPNSTRMTRVSRIVATALCAALGLCVLAGKNFTGSQATAQEKVGKTGRGQLSVNETKIGDEALRQMTALLEEKELRTPAQQKIDSNLLYEARRQRGQEMARGVPMLDTGINVDELGGVTVDIRAEVTRELLEAIQSAGGTIIDSLAAYRSVTARMPISAIESLAERNDVRFIMQNYGAQTHNASNASFNDIPQKIWNTDRTPSLLKLPLPKLDAMPRRSARPTFAERAERVREFLKEKLNDGPETGSVNSQGDTTHQANTFRSTIGPNGAGIKIGVLSDGTTAFATAQASGNLPAVLNILPGQIGNCTAGTCNEGTAMLEIIHDVAPGAELYFASANPNIARFAQNVRDLRTAGCDIIVDDVFYFVETPFQDGQAPSVVSNTNGGVVTQAVKDVTAAGAMFFSSAGNQGNVDDVSASTYQGDFTSAGTIAILPAGGTVHDFGAGAQSNLVAVASGNSNNLYWADPLGGSTNDYDLFTINNAGTAILASSTNVQSGTQDPFEITAAAAVNTRIVVYKKTAAANRFFHLTSNANGAGRLTVTTPGTTKGHSMPADAYSVAATPAQAPGPFPGAHTTANTTETFSSDGPRRIFFLENGTAITPGNFSSTGGLLRQKPDITAADGVSVTGAGGFPTTFFGTSAAAPHAAAIAGLLKSGLPTPTNAQIRTAFNATALDIETAGVDRNTGVGIIMPLPSATNLGILSQAHIDKTGFTLTERPGNSDGDGQVERGERANLVISGLINYGAQNANTVSVSVTSTTPGVTLVAGSPRPGSGGGGGGGDAPEAQGYPNLTSAGGTGSNLNPHVFLLGPTYTCGAPINFTMTVTYNDGSARTRVLNFTADVTTALSVTTTMDVTAPPASPSYTATTGTQTNRVTRDGASSICSAPKAAFPGLTAATNPRYDAYVFTATQSGCNVVSYTGGNGGSTGLFATVYSGAFVPTAIGTNYLADSGFSPGTGATSTFAFNAVAGQQYTVVVAEVTPNTTQTYTLTVRGPSTTVCNSAPTAASVPVSGRILTAGGQPIRNAEVVLQDGNGVAFTAVTGTLGYYSFESIPVGTYVIGVNSKRYSVPAKIVTITDTVQDLDLVAVAAAQ